MRIVITGGAGMIGRKLVGRLLEKGALADAAGEERSIREVVVCDVATPDPPMEEDPRLRVV
ncbi:MAG: NAD(P)-dependent oxidoreductase, partial [Akkermansiaceae bacterium]|nr:NAD(P)-dependent oxidoreductase [Akkermansiaceae bacterium]